MMSGIVPVKDPEIKYKQIFINNEFVDSVSGKTFPTLNPATGEKIADVAEGDKADVDLAVAAARKAFALGSPWRTMDASQRGAMLYKLSGLIEKNMALLATIETMDNGKLFSNACRDIAGAVGCMRYFAGIADKLVGETIPVDGNFFCYTRHEPIGVVGQIIPWNFPAFLAVGKISPALAAGCVCIVKPAEQTPLTALMIAQLVKEAGFPPGVVNVIPGYGPTAGKAISEHMDIDKVAFTGSTEVGRIIQQASGQTNLKKVTLELGGKSPNIVFSDVDLDTAVPAAVRAVMFNQGQVCVAGTRTFVQEDIYDEFVKRSVEQAQKWQVGDPFTTSGDAAYGAQIDETQTNKIMELIESGKNQGAKLLTGGKRMEGKGYFVEPTVFTDVKDDMRIAKEEIFGPVQSIFKFKTIDEVITRANTTMYGLGAAVFTKDIEKAITIANSIQAGTVWVNCYGAGLPQAPFGGYKMSGIGREYGTYGVKEYQQVKTVVVKIGQKNS